MPNIDESVSLQDQLSRSSRLSARSLSQQARLLSGARGGDPHTQVELRRDGLRVKTQAQPASRFPSPFGFLRIDQAAGAVVVRAGIVQWGTESVLTEEASVAVAGGTKSSPTWGVFRFDLAAKAGAMLSATVLDRPTNVLGESPIHQRPVFRAYIASGRIVIASWDWAGVIDLTGFFAP